MRQSKSCFSLAPPRMVSQCCSACVSRVGLSTKQATELYSDNLLNRTRNTSEPYSDKEIPLRRALRRLLCWLGSQLGIHRKSGFSLLGTVHETVLRQLLITYGVGVPFFSGERSSLCPRPFRFVMNFCSEDEIFVISFANHSHLLANFWSGPSAEMCRGFLLYEYWRILPGIFLEDFSVHFFHKNEEKKSGD